MRVWMGLLCAAIAFGAHAAEPLHGRVIKYQAGGHERLAAPVTLPAEGLSADGPITVVQGATGLSFPATLRNGEFVFIPEGSPPDVELGFYVQVAPKRAHDENAVVITKRDNEDVLDVHIEGKLFTAYHYGQDLKKPFLWPVNSVDGITVTRDFPMGNVEETPRHARDHPHHRSFWTSYGDVNGIDLWTEGAACGIQRSGAVTFGSGDAYGWIHAKNSWQTKEGKHLLTEEREYRFYWTPERARLFDTTVTFTADDGDVLFKDTKEGGIASARMRPELSYANAMITNALGDRDEANTWGKPAAWCDFSGKMTDNLTLGLSIFDHPTNLRHPTSWHVRGYGLMGANSFGYSYFGEKEYNKGLLPMENGDYTIKAGESLRFTYRTYVHTGDASEAKVADRYADFADPPKASWVDSLPDVPPAADRTKPIVFRDSADDPHH